MKNIHVLPTDKPSRLFEIIQFNLSFDNQNMYSEEYKKLHSYKNKNIYITSDEDIDENDYIITKDGRLVQISYLLSKDLEGASKVILTTGQDLIKDGIQSIPDNFLEWFVNNPSCEEVEIEKFHGINTSIAEVSSISGNDDYNWQGKGDFRDYKIIIPKEEPKQICEYCKIQITKYGCGCGTKEPKQERKYSEEDLKQFAFECVGNFLSNRENELEIELVNVISDRNNKLFEKFKNK